MALSVLKKRADFLRVARKCVSIKTSSLVLQCSLSPHKTNQCGFTATRRTGNAVKRNRSKRRLRALARSLIPDSFNGLAPVDFVFISRSCTSFVNFEQLKNDCTFAVKYCLENLLKRPITLESTDQE